MFRDICRRITSALRPRVLEDEVERQHAEIVLQRNELAQREAEGTRLRAEIARQQSEIERRREENRALLNSILGVAGIPPIHPARDTFAAAEFAHVAAENHGTKCPGSEDPSYVDPEKSPAQCHSESSTRPVEEERLPDRCQPAEEAGFVELGSSVTTRFRTPPPTPAAENESSGTPARLPIVPSEAGTRSLNCPVHSDANVRPRNDTRLSSATGSRVRPLIAPLRRRSWHQITQALELKSARKSVTSD